MPARLRPVTMVFAALAFAGCTTDIAPGVERAPLGDFSLEHLVVVVDAPIRSPVSRGASDAMLDNAVRAAVAPRLERFTGNGEYSLGIKVQGYALAPRGIPIVFAPRSTLFLSVNVYDEDADRLNESPRNFTIWEDSGADTVFGSGYTQSADEQLAELAENAAIEIERWLRENAGWFTAAAAPRAGEPGA